MFNPYSFSKLKNALVYTFTTKNKIAYKVHFVNDETLVHLSGIAELKQAYQIVIVKLTDKIEPFDSRVFLTIESIIIEFFKDTQKILAFVCDSSDGKQMARFKKFNRWHENSKHNQSIIKFNDDYVDADVELFYSIMVHQHNPKFKQLEQAFFSIKEILLSEKP